MRKGRADVGGQGHDRRVLVVGAGPVGLMLACELRLNGIEVVVLERRREPTTESRASTLHARTVEIMAARGLLSALDPAKGGTRGHFGGIPLDLSGPGPHTGLWKVPQTWTEVVLGRRARELGARVLRGHEVRALLQDDEGVTAITSQGPVRGGHLVACDGQDSTVRDLVAVGFPGWSARRELLRADVAGIDVRPRRFERLPNGMAVAALGSGGVTRVMVHRLDTVAGERTAPATFDDVVTAWKHVTGEDIGSGEPVWVDSFDDTNRQVARYRVGRVLFAGDAAHRQMPVGGQALNLGLQDAVNLGWKLGLCSGGRAGEDLLDTYHSERHPVGRRALANIRAQTLLLLGGPEVDPVRDLVTELLHHEEARRRLAGQISGLGIGYDALGGGGGPLDTDVLAHDRAAVEAVREATENGRGLLLHSRAAGSQAAAARPWADRVSAVEVAPGPGVRHALLVRPDGHIAWTDEDGPDPAPALRHWFGHP